MSAVLRQVAALVRRDLLIEVSYHFRLIFFLTGAFAAAFLAYYVSDLVTDSPLLAEYDGTYFDFVVVGIAVTSYASLGVSTFTQQVMSEMGAGTLEVLLSGPNRIGTLLAGGFVVPWLFTTIEVAALIGVGVGVFGAGVSIGHVAAGIPVVALTLVNFGALGVVSAALVLLVKRGDPISGPVFQATLLMSGAVFPIELFPGWLEWACRLTPAYYGVRGSREALLTDAGLTGTLDEIAILVAFDVVAVPLALILFGRSIRSAKRYGLLTSY